MIDAGWAGVASIVIDRAEILALGWDEGPRLEKALLHAVSAPEPHGLEVFAEWTIHPGLPDRYLVRTRGDGVPCVTTLPPDPRATRETPGTGT